MIDFLKYKPVINRVLSKFNVPANKREDMTQECYLALVQKQDHLEEGIAKGKDEAYAVTICRGCLIDKWRVENDVNNRSDDNPKLWFNSLSDPRVYQKVAKISSPESEISDEKLYSGIFSLAENQFRVIYSLYVDGKTLKETASELGLSDRALRTQRDRGIQNLKKHFEVE